MEARRSGGELSLSPRASTLLGAYLPVLEGLALYCELDAEEAPDDLIIPNPVPLHTQMMTLTWNVDESCVLQHAREEQVIETGTNGPGLLRLLFADPHAPECAHYFVGYLWIKAASSVLAKLNSRFSRSTVALPFLIRLLCDHPVIAKVWTGQADHDVIAAELLKSVAALNARSLARVYEALLRPDLLASFELWDLHGFLADPLGRIPRLQSMKVLRPFFAGRQPSSLENRVRLSASIHLPSRATGKLLDAQASGSGLEFTIVTDAGEEVSGNILPIASVWQSLAASERYRELCEKHSAVAEKLEAMVWTEVRRLVGKRVTVATYWALTAPLVFGVVIWGEGAPMMQLPMEPHWFEFKDHIEITQAGLSLSVEERLDFAASLPPATDATMIGRAANETFLSHLVSDPGARWKMLRKRFSGILLSDPERKSLEDWVACPLFRPEPWQLGEPAASRLRAAFDCPGFGTDVRFPDLLPQILAFPLDTQLKEPAR